MGSILAARCTCGFHADALFLGGGFANHQVYSGAPARCDACGRFQISNFLDRSATCRDCRGHLRFYDDPQLYHVQDRDREGGSRRLFSWNAGPGFVLIDADYLCPQCGEYHLHFSSVGHWD